LFRLDVKYGLPRGGPALTRLAAQVEESIAVGDEATTVVWSYRAPTQAVIKAVEKALGSNYSKVVFKSGIHDLLVYLRTFF
jgi:hypothetical protein